MGERIRSTPETIARTEVIGAYNGGTWQAWRQSGVVTKKRWLAALDDRTRPTHVDAHDQVVGIDEDFSVGGFSGPCPGSMGDAGEDINCRCTMTAVLDISDKG
jgi:SPP1 gp7 family putative phage head morphogenesis protein